MKGGSTTQEWKTLKHLKFCFPDFISGSLFLGHIQEALEYGVGLKEVYLWRYSYLCKNSIGKRFFNSIGNSFSVLCD